MKRVIFAVLLVFCATAIKAQDMSLTFTSVTDAKFYVYLNGVLQNQKSSGMVTLKGLEEKEYHVRIVVDDPFMVATTRKIKPDKKHSEYTVRFNAVKERVDLKLAKNSDNEYTEWQPAETSEQPAAEPEPSQPNTPKVSIRKTDTGDTATQRIVNRLRTEIVVE